LVFNHTTNGIQLTMVNSQERVDSKSIDGFQVTQNWMVFTFHVPFWNEKWLVQRGTTLELASPEQTAIGKDVSNPFMAVMVCQKPLDYFSSPMIHVPRAGLMLLFHDPAVFDVPADCSCWFPHFYWFLVAAVLFHSCSWNKVTILELSSEDLSRILKLTLSNSRLGEDCWESQISLDIDQVKCCLNTLMWSIGEKRLLNRRFARILLLHLSLDEESNTQGSLLF
nr:hypothetical protein [Tanacetum cinerariifolium]